MKNKNKGIENKIILGDFNCTLDKMGRHGGNKTQRIYRCRSNYALLKLIVNNGLEDLWKRITQIPLSSLTMIDPLAQDPGKVRSILI